MIFLTLQIADERFAFSFSMLKKLLKIYEERSGWVAGPRASGHRCLTSFHIFIFVYLVCGLKLTSNSYHKNLYSFINQW